MGVIYITGMTGAGKTVVGENLARLVSLSFVDLDAEIERRAGKTVQEIFRAEGESAFRELETNELHVQSKRENIVVALGAGALVRNENYRMVCESGILVYLRASVKTLISRQNLSMGRPMLQPATTPEELERILEVMLQKREDRYSQAAIIVDVESFSDPATLAVSIADRIPQQ